MKKFLFVLFIFALIFQTGYAQIPACWANPGIEGPLVAHNVPAPWVRCFGSPDTQPGQWGITMAPSQGNSYVSFLHSGWSATGYNEGMTQLLNPPLVAGQPYQFRGVPNWH